MAKARHKNPRTAMRYIKPGGEVAEGTGILGPSRRMLRATRILESRISASRTR